MKNKALMQLKSAVVSKSGRYLKSKDLKTFETYCRVLKRVVKKKFIKILAPYHK